MGTYRLRVPASGVGYVPRTVAPQAVGVWTADMSDAAHLRVLGTYIHFEPKLAEPSAFDISPKGPGTNDPMYIVEATRA